MNPVPSQVMSVGLHFLMSWLLAHEGKRSRSGEQGLDSHEHDGKNFRESTSESQLILLFQG